MGRDTTTNYNPTFGLRGWGYSPFDVTRHTNTKKHEYRKNYFRRRDLINQED